MDDTEGLLSKFVDDDTNETITDVQVNHEIHPDNSQNANYGSGQDVSDPMGSADNEQCRDSVDDSQSIAVNSNTDEKSLHLSSHKKLTFAGIAITYMSMLMSFSVLAPFFPYEAEKKGVSPTLTGFVFGIFALTSFIAAPILGKYLPVLGAKYMFLSGSFVAAGCNLLFGFLDKIDGTTLFLIYCFVIRVVEAIGSSACITAGMAIVANVFPDNVAQMGGLLEMFSGLGFAIGPPLGSLFYGLGGYKLPFIVLGCFAMVMAIINSFILPSLGSQEKDSKPGSLLSVAKIPAVWVILLACVWGSACLGFTDPTLSLHLTNRPFSVKPSLVGVIFLLVGGVYAATAPIWGYIADKKRTTRIMMALGFYGTGISFLLIGPSPLLNLPSQLWIVILSLALLGFSIGISLMPAFLDLLTTAKWYGLPEDLSTQAIISGVFNGSFAMGTFLGPTVAGFLVNLLGFDWSSTLFAGGCFLVMIMISIFGVWEYQCGKGRRIPQHMVTVSDPENRADEPLIVNA